MKSKENQYKHEIKSRDLQIDKFKQQLSQKLFEKATKNQLNGQIDNKECVPIANAEIKFSRLGGESDFQIMMARSNEEIQRRLADENAELKECLKHLQRELFDIVDLKTEVFMKRYKAEFSQLNEQKADSEEVLRHEIDKIRDEIFNLPFQQSGQEIIQKFQANLVKLRSFMEKIDKEIASMSVFNEKSDVTFDDVSSKFSGITSVQQLKHLLNNYDALVEGQHQLLNQSITKMAKIPAPDEVASAFNRFQILKDSEIDDMRRFLNEHKATMQQQYKEFDQEKKSFDDMTTRMEQEKLKISEERERIEAEVRKIKELNNQIQSQLFVSVK